MTKQCPERCLGVEGHQGHHQTTDYPEIQAAARRLAVERIRERIREYEDGPNIGLMFTAAHAILDEEAAR